MTAGIAETIDGTIDGTAEMAVGIAGTSREATVMG